MKKLLWIILLSTALFSQNVYTKKDITVIDKIVVDIKTKKPINGTIKLYLKTGELVSSTQYKNGKMDGVRKGYFKTGILEYETPYKDGKLNGIGKRYYTTGTIRSETSFKDGEENGVVKFYAKTGKLAIEVIIKDRRATNGFIYEKDGKKIKMTKKHFQQFGIPY